VTQSAIEAQLRELVNKPPANKQDVVYALVEIRKVLEHANQRKALWTLTFFCDWALHTKLDRAGASKILGMLDARLGRFNPAKRDQFDENGMIHEILSLNLFRQHLLAFLTQNHLPTVWAEDQFAWNKTLMFYGDQVRDTPLIMARKDYRFKYLRKLIVTACEPDPAIIKANPGQKYWGLRWQFTLNDGRTFPMGYNSNVPEPPPGWRTQGVL